MADLSDFQTNPLIQDQGSLGTFSDSSPLGGNYPFGSSLSEPAKLPPSSKESKESALPDISGNIKQPGFMQLAFPGMFGGGAGVQFQYQKYINQQVRPIASTIMQEFSKSMNSGDYDRANEAVLGMSNLASKAPMFGKVVDSMTDQLNKRRTNFEQNSANIDFYSSQTKDPEQLQALQFLKSRASILPSDATLKAIENILPNVTVTDQSTTKVNKITGQATKDTLPITMNVKDLSPEQQTAFNIAGIDPADYIQTHNKLAVGKGNLEDAKKLSQYQSALQQNVSQAESFKRIPAGPRLQYGMSPEQAQGLSGTGIPGQQPLQGPGMMNQAPQQGPGQGIQQQQSFQQQQQQPQNQLQVFANALKATEGSQATGPGSVSPKGALGRFQIMPSTAANILKVDESTAKRLLTDPDINEAVGMKHLKDLVGKFGFNPEAIAGAWHSGEGNISPQGRVIDPNRSDKTATTPGITTGEYVQRFMSKLPPSMTQQVVQQGIDIKAQQEAAQTQAKYQAQTTNEPQKSEHFYFKMNDKGELIGSQERTSEAEKIKSGYASMPYAAGIPVQQSYNSALTSVNDALDQLKKTPNLDIPDQAREVIGRAFAAGTSLPVLGKLFTTLPLSQEQRDTLTKLALANSSIQQYYKTMGIDSPEMGAIRDQITGILSKREMSYDALENVKESMINRMQGFMRPLNPGSVQDYQPEKRTPPVSQQINQSTQLLPGQANSTIGNVLEALQGKNAPVNQQTGIGKGITEASNLSEAAQIVLKDVANLPKNLEYLANHPETKRVRDEVLGWIKDKLSNLSSSTSTTRTPKLKQPQGPISSSTMKALTGFQ